MKPISVIFGAVCLLAIVSISTTSRSDDVDPGDVIAKIGQAIKVCTATIGRKKIRDHKVPYYMVACVLKRFKIMDSRNRLNFKRIDEVSILKRMRSPIYKWEVSTLKKCSAEVTNYKDESEVAKELIKCTVVGGVKEIFKALD